MGLFDFFKRRSDSIPFGASAARAGPSPEYVFAHQILRQAALDSPLQFLALVASPEREQFLNRLLNHVARTTGRRVAFEAADIEVHLRQIEKFPCPVFEFPSVRNVPEAYMVAVLVPIDTTTATLSETNPLVGRYFTLEKAIGASDSPATVVGEWIQDAHRNYGPGPAVRVNDFVAAIDRICRAESGRA